MPTRILILSEAELEENEQYEKDVLAEVETEFRAQDPVYQNVRCCCFVSKSKGWRKRNGVRVKRRTRRNWEEVRLLSYRGGPFMVWRKFPFDEYATECLGQEVSSEDAEKVFVDRIEMMDWSRWRDKGWRS